MFGFLRCSRLKPFAVPEVVTARLTQIEAGKQRILCASDVYEQVRDKVYGTGGDADYVVLENRWLQDGQVLLAQSEANMEDELQTAGQRMMDELVAKWEREHRAAEFVRRAEYLYGAAVYQPPPFSPIITGV